VIEPKIGDYVLVQYDCKRKVFYVGQALKEKDEGDLEIKFLRKHPRVEDGFTEPNIEDIHAVPSFSLVMVLPPPVTPASTKRVLGIKKFAVDLTGYIQ